MKTVKIAKSSDFSSDSKVILHVGSKEIHIEGFGSYIFTLEPGEDFRLTHQWTSSPIMSYEELHEENHFLVKPRLDKRLLNIILFLFTLCTIVFFILKSRWSYVPLVPFIVYIVIYLTALKNKYLILKTVKEIEIVTSKEI